VIGVAGCVAQQEGDAILRRFAAVDFVYGTHNLRLVRRWSRRPSAASAACGSRESRSPERFDLPQHHPDLRERDARPRVRHGDGRLRHVLHFCVVPHTRGREISRAAAAIEAGGAPTRVVLGVREITLLGQTVNAYGRHDVRRGRAACSARRASRRCCAGSRTCPGSSASATRARTRRSSTTISCARTASSRRCARTCTCPRRAARTRCSRGCAGPTPRDDYRALCDRLRASRPDLALTTDLIVGFPGETDADFAATLALVRDVAFVDAYTFKYSPRPNTPPRSSTARSRPRSPQARLESSRTSCARSRSSAHRRRVGSETEVLDRGRRAAVAIRLSGRDPYHRVVNLAARGGIDRTRRARAGARGRGDPALADRRNARVGDRIAGEERRRPRR
jgi:tRNA-2-methylthio-N6-dimethylallyladenosine synthase